MKTSLNRRAFLQHGSVTAAGLVAAPWLSFGKGSANEKLNVAFVGTANRAGADLAGVAKETELANVVALCDVDENFLAAAKQKHPRADTYTDFREMLERKDLDCVVVGTPDHTHAVAAVAALRAGCHVYCEKPLARTVSEVRIITDTARKLKRVTQMGNQIHSGTNFRRVVELVQSGAIGEVREVHVWVGSTYGGSSLPTDTPPVPNGLHYDLWVGPAKFLPYHPEYVPFKWRNWWNFGGGSLADFGCHYMDLPHWALGLSHPLSVEVVDGPPVHRDSPPPWLIMRYEYPQRDALPPVRLTWYHGGKQAPMLTDDQRAKWKSGVLFVGSRGKLLANYTNHVLLPEAAFADFKRPEPFIPDSVGHHKEWLLACKTGGKPGSNFDYAGPLTEAALLGNVAYRTGKKLEWDAKKLRAANAPEADEFIQHHYRKGWKI
ncbi:MAG: Gfo/Idh/MocA family oxidoreductase [Verrucomicrobia bacterium]|nr:Gfo/Idh/MocA family oxidoreductase [Verrucomicrobiota bacterium]